MPVLSLIFLCALQEPVPIKFQNALVGGVLNREGTHLVRSTGSLIITNLKDGTGSAERFLTYLARGNPPRIVAATDRQDREKPTQQSAISALSLAPTRVFDSIGSKRILSLTPQSSWKYPKEVFHILSEIRLDKRGLDANVSWVQRSPVGTFAMPVAARFASWDTVSYWSIVRTGTGWDLLKLVGNRIKPSYNLQRISQIRTGLPANAKEVVYYPETSTFIYNLGQTNKQAIFYLADLRGKVLKSVDLVGLAPSRYLDVQGAWELAVPSEKVPEGKDKWIPLSSSPNLKIWLVMSKENSEASLLRL